MLCLQCEKKVFVFTCEQSLSFQGYSIFIGETNAGLMQRIEVATVAASAPDTPLRKGKGISPRAGHCQHAQQRVSLGLLNKTTNVKAHEIDEALK